MNEVITINRHPNEEFIEYKCQHCCYEALGRRGLILKQCPSCYELMVPKERWRR